MSLFIMIDVSKKPTYIEGHAYMHTYIPPVGSCVQHKGISTAHWQSSEGISQGCIHSAEMTPEFEYICTVNIRTYVCTQHTYCIAGMFCGL